MAKASWRSRLSVVVAMAVGVAGPVVATEDPGVRSLDAILDLPSPAFFEALGALGVDAPVPSDGLWPILDRCRHEVDDEGPGGESEEDGRARFEREYACGEVGQLLAGLAAGTERDRVLAMLDAPGDDHWLREHLLRGLLDGKLAEVVGRLPIAATPAPLPEPLPPVPERLKDASSDLQQAWQLHHGLVAAYWSHLESAREGGEVSYREKRADFEAAVVDFLRGRSRPEDAVALLRRFVWGGGCGTGSDRFLEPLGRTLLLAHLETGESSLAAGAALAAREWRAGRHPALPEDWERRLLGALGYDWKAVAVGRLLEGWPLQDEALGSPGSDRAARLLVSARDVPLHDEGDERLADQDEYLHTLAAFVAPSGGCRDYGTSSSQDVERAPDAGVVGADVEADILELLESRVRPGAGLREAETAAHILVKTCRDESRLAFRQMLGSPYTKVREAGALALRSLGEEVRTLPSAPPVVFRLTVDGVPARGMSLSESLVRQEGRSWTESTVTTDEDGLLRVDRDPFLDPKDVVEGVTFSPSQCASPEDLCFSVAVPRPERLDRVIPVSVSTQALTLSCPAAAEHELNVFVFRLGEEGEQDELRMGVPLPRATLPGQGPLTFSRLQRGRYQVLVFGEGGHWSHELELGDRAVAVECDALEGAAAGGGDEGE